MPMCGSSWFIAYIENADSPTKVSSSALHLWIATSSEGKCRVYYLTDIMSSLCHPPSKSPWSIIKENHHKAYMHWLLIWLKKDVYTFPLCMKGCRKTATLSERESRLVSLTTFHLPLHFKEIQETLLIAYSISALIWRGIYRSLQELSSVFSYH